MASNEEPTEGEERYIPPTKHVKRPTIPLLTTQSKAWQHIIQANNLHELPKSAAIFHAKKVARYVEYAISDSGTTGPFLVDNAAITNKKVATNPITITLPNRKYIKSTHTHATSTYHGYLMQ